MDYVLKIMNVEDETRDTRKFTIVRPAGFTFEPGKSVLVSINKPGLEDNKKLCTFFSLNHDFYLELLFKENSVLPDSRPFLDVKAGEEIIMSDLVGNIDYKGKGAFIAAGKGLFPFINIFKHLQRADALPGHTLIYFAKDGSDLMFERMLRVNFAKNATIVLGKDSVNSNEVKKIDEAILRQKLPNLEQNFYIAGPKSFVEEAERVLGTLGIKPQSEILE